MSWKNKFPRENRYFETENGILYNEDSETLLKKIPTSSVDLIYIDPPFGIPRDKVFGMERWNSTEEHYKFLDSIGLSIIKKIDQRKRSNRGIAHYLYWLYSKLQLMKNVLKDTGSIYIHIDHHMDSYIRILLDEIFGPENFVNEITWCTTGASNVKKNFPRKHDIIFLYSKDHNNYIFNKDAIRIPYSEESLKRANWRVIPRDKMKFDQIKLNENGKVPEDYWIDIQRATRYPGESVGYDTQKPEKLLERIIKASSNPDSIVADFFCGSGTTAAVAQKLGRRWIASDMSARAMETTKSRLVNQKVAKR